VAVGDIVPVPGDSFEQTLTAASPDLPREMIRAFVQKMMDAEVEVACGAGYGEVSAQRVNSRNGRRPRDSGRAPVRRGLARQGRGRPACGRPKLGMWLCCGLGLRR